MKLVMTCPVRNSDWVLGYSLRTALLWVDEVVILDHASTDDTPEIIREVRNEHPDRVHAWRDNNETWAEMSHRQFLLEKAREREATHIVMVDDDEVLTANLLPVIRDLMPKHGQILQIPWVCVGRGMPDRFYADGVWYNNFVSTAFADMPHLHWKPQAGGYDHHHRHPMGSPLVPFRPLSYKNGGLLHYQFLSERRVRAKACLYQMIEKIRWPERDTAIALNRKYGRAVYESDPLRYKLKEFGGDWQREYVGLRDHYFHPDREPWQVEQIRKYRAEHPPELFAGLDTYGIE